MVTPRSPAFISFKQAGAPAGDAVHDLGQLVEADGAEFRHGGEDAPIQHIVEAPDLLQIDEQAHLGGAQVFGRHRVQDAHRVQVVQVDPVVFGAVVAGFGEPGIVGRLQVVARRWATRHSPAPTPHLPRGSWLGSSCPFTCMA